MSWIPLNPTKPADKATAAVTISCSVSERFQPRVFIVVRPALLPDLTWWQPGQRCDVALGSGEHHGALRITQEKTVGARGSFALRASGGKAAAGTATKVPMLVLPLLPGMVAAKHAPMPVEFDYSDTWLEITLPDWARGAVPSPPPATKTPYKGALGTALPVAARG